MRQEARNDEQAKRMIDWLYAEGVSAENIARLLNYHFTCTFQCDKDSRYKASIKRVPDGSNYAPSVEIWKQP